MLCARLPRHPYRHSISYLLDLRNSSLGAGLLISDKKGYRMNSSAGEELLRIVESQFFRHVPYPADWNRYEVPWYTIAHTQLPSLNQSRNRVLLSSVRTQMGDGLGHMYYMYNFEVFLATRLNLSFTHRHSTYQSLTKADKYAVDNFFGWGKGELPREKVWDECVLSYSYYMNTRNAYKCTTCESVEGKGMFGFNHVVKLPSFLVYNCTSKYGWSAQCDELAHKILTENNDTHTIFQMPPGSCDYEGTNTNVSETGPWFYHKYWNLHGRRNGVQWPHEFSPQRSTAVRFRPRHLNLAVHIRRGDFFNETKRRMFPDKVFARTVADVLDIVDSVNGSFALSRPVVHIYSEGRRRPELRLTSHDVHGMDNTYYDETHNPRSSVQWEHLIKGMEKSDERLRGKLRRRVEVMLHISEETMDNMHEMVSADVFIGSDSAMSLGPVYMLSRGVKLLRSGPFRREDPLFAKFDGETGNIITSRHFFNAWRLYEAGNGHSLLYALSRTASK